MIARRAAVALAVAVSVAGAGVGLARSQTGSPASTGPGGRPAGRPFLDALTGRLGIERPALVQAVKDVALAEVDWAVDNGFLSPERAADLRQRIREGWLGPWGVGGPGLGWWLGGPRWGWPPGCPRFWGRGPVAGPAVRFVGGPGAPGPWRLHRAGPPACGLAAAAAAYLGMSPGRLRAVLAERTLAQVAEDRGRTVGGLREALLETARAALDPAVDRGAITRAQADALLKRLDRALDDVLDGVPPFLGALAQRLGVSRSRLVEAVREAAADRVDAALRAGLITRQRAGALKARIRTAPLWPSWGLGPAPCGWVGPPAVRVAAFST